ncbi:endonuclease/exonuclease/phosphatase family protein [Streptomyces sp. ITFR-16]|uniref:endonuclease/exonuclease/phosphatase family protein n=1 Tax=Streptomyces sp. ITFR-16 TaxID=3075198 RepID=UPI00288B2147|nr:endonuclease/exonuclease/phosphatase family protein [Streptomyces sp. ITFR-16]WNI21754.1 endonuclease/exonuclease/phosphatase family protein [Streptomyces sp. ITFR-16]
MPRRRGLLPAGVLAVLLALSAACGPTGVPATEAVPVQVVVATWNMCGVRQWNCEGTGSGAQKARALTELPTDTGARVVMLQEVCAGDLAAARTELGPAWHSAFKAYRSFDAQGHGTPVPCGAARRGVAGIAILASSALSHVSEPSVRQPATGLHRGILCATAAAAHLRVCNAHLSLPGTDASRPELEFRDDQLASLVDTADGRTVFGGDLNSAPPSPGDAAGWIWPHDAYRRYRECDQRSASSRAGRPTHRTGHKVDYLFTALPRAGCSVRDTGRSDHSALVLRVEAGRGSDVGPGAYET